MAFEEEFEDTKEVIKIHKSKKNRQHNGQRKKNDKRTNNDFKTYTRTPLKTGGKLRYSGRANSSRLVNLVTNPVISHE
jgi:hypothetical protein